ncbi:MAG TPA: DinB family protein, partial [Candidatus Binatus sp.]|nr:DinB family protein [Candidatus Binatus sp.]
MTTPDPVDQAKAYQEALLSALGRDDPAEAQAGTPDRIRRLVSDAGDLLRVRPEPGEWSVLECIGHVVDDETVMSARYRWVLAQDEPELDGFDRERRRRGVVAEDVLQLDRLGRRRDRLRVELGELGVLVEDVVQLALEAVQLGVG